MKKKHRSSARPAFHGVSAGARQVAAARCSPAPLPPPDWLTLPLPARPNAVTGASGGDPATERKGAVNPPRPTTAGADKQTQRPPLTVLFIPCPPPPSPAAPCLLPSVPSPSPPAPRVRRGVAGWPRGTVRGTLGAGAGRTDLRPTCPRWRGEAASASRNVSSCFAGVLCFRFCSDLHTRFFWGFMWSGGACVRASVVAVEQRPTGAFSWPDRLMVRVDSVIRLI
jgi:hypothetical protein